MQSINMTSQTKLTFMSSIGLGEPWEYPSTETLLLHGMDPSTEALLLHGLVSMDDGDEDLATSISTWTAS